MVQVPGTDSENLGMLLSLRAYFLSKTKISAPPGVQLPTFVSHCITFHRAAREGMRAFEKICFSHMKHEVLQTPPLSVTVFLRPKATFPSSC